MQWTIGLWRRQSVDKQVQLLIKNHRFYKTRRLLKMIRLALKLDRNFVSSALNISVRQIYNIEEKKTLINPIISHHLYNLCQLYKIDYELIYEKMDREHKDTCRICLK